VLSYRFLVVDARESRTPIWFSDETAFPLSYSTHSAYIIARKVIVDARESRTPIWFSGKTAFPLSYSTRNLPIVASNSPGGVGLERLELPTSYVTNVRSFHQLSYSPIILAILAASDRIKRLTTTGGDNAIDL
jgi:hypothetical protein